MRIALLLIVLGIASAANAQDVKATEVSRTTLVTYGAHAVIYGAPTDNTARSFGFEKSGDPGVQVACVGPIITNMPPVSIVIQTTELGATERLLYRMFPQPSCAGPAGPLSVQGLCRPDNAACTGVVGVVTQ